MCQRPGQCGWCGAEASSRCTRCLSVYYCNRQCQRAAWPRHRPSCSPTAAPTNTTIHNSEDPVVGSFMVAATDIQAGTQLLSEMPVAVGPQLVAAPQCLECGRILNTQAEARPCAGCGWPLCATNCLTDRAGNTKRQQSTNLIKSSVCPSVSHTDINQDDNDGGSTHHSVEECRILARDVDAASRPTAGQPATPHYDCILPLRVLLLRQRRPRQWRRVRRLESHATRRRDTPIYHDNQRHVVDYLLQQCRLQIHDLNTNVAEATDDQETDDNGGEQSLESLLHQICGVLDVNAFALRPSAGYGERRALYCRAARMNHSCVSNTAISLDGRRMVVRASVDIPAGAAVTAAYMGAYEPTRRRQDYLRRGKHFECSCRRCSDNTELGTHFGSHRCCQCGGFMISEQPMNAEAAWVCSGDHNTRTSDNNDDNDKNGGAQNIAPGCGHRESAEHVRQLNQQLLAERTSCNQLSVQQLEAFVTRHMSDRLHATNYHVLAVTQRLAQLYGNTDTHQLQLLDRRQLQRKAALCRLVIGVSERFEPGQSRLRAALLIELHHAVVTLARQLHATAAAAGSYTARQQLLTQLQEGGACLRQAIAMLQQEPRSTPEGGALLDGAQDTLSSCCDFIGLVESGMPDVETNGETKNSRVKNRRRAKQKR